MPSASRARPTTMTTSSTSEPLPSFASFSLCGRGLATASGHRRGSGLVRLGVVVAASRRRRARPALLGGLGVGRPQRRGRRPRRCRRRPRRRPRSRRRRPRRRPAACPPRRRRRSAAVGVRVGLGSSGGRRFVLRPRASSASTPSRGRAGVLALADAGAAADAAAQVVELRAPDVAAAGHLDPLDLGRVHGERALDADAERLLADGEGLARALRPGA